MFLVGFCYIVAFKMNLIEMYDTNIININIMNLTKKHFWFVKMLVLKTQTSSLIRMVILMLCSSKIQTKTFC